MTHTNILSNIRNGLIRFHKDEDGSNSVEAMLMMPLMVWAYLATYVFFDAYRVQSINAKAGYTIGDILSRQATSYVTPEFIDSLWSLQEFLVETGDPARLRVTTFVYDETNDLHEIIWSEVRGGGAPLDNARLALMSSAIPMMADGEVGIMVQSEVEYIPVFGAGIAEMDFDDFVITKPRYAGKLCFHPVNYPSYQDPNLGICDPV